MNEGINASESSLARVSLVNYHNVILDEICDATGTCGELRDTLEKFGIRASDMINGMSLVVWIQLASTREKLFRCETFEEVQKKQ